MIPSVKTAVDVIVLHRPGVPPKDRVLQAIRDQRTVDVTLHLVVGAAGPHDTNRWITIARARNTARSLGESPWVMFVDDDVLLESDCIMTLLGELQQSDRTGVVAADYSDDRSRTDRVGHVAMGATLFRRRVLQRLNFRATDRLCECWCACLDLRCNRIGIRYSDAAKALHLRDVASSAPAKAVSYGIYRTYGTYEEHGTNSPEPRILAAFDRRDIDRFEHQFLKTLRSHGNRQQVTAVGYGLYPSERRRLEKLDRVVPDWQSYNGVMPPVRRISDFARHLADVDPRTPVAYWDVADVVFQESLCDLWQTVNGSPDRLLAVIEPKGYPDNAVIPAWSLSIRHPQFRRRAFELLKRNPFLNSGFAAGTAAVMLKYFRSAVEMRHGPELTGTSDWGDQMCLNIYCHMHPGRWRSADLRWNYCVHDRPVGEVRVTPHGQITSRSGVRISVAHGNARSLRQFAILRAK